MAARIEDLALHSELAETRVMSRRSSARPTRRHRRQKGNDVNARAAVSPSELACRPDGKAAPEPAKQDRPDRGSPATGPKHGSGS